jgi:hypothetical protein
MKADEVFKLAERIAAFQNKPEDKNMKRPRRAPRHLMRMNDYDIVAELHKALERADTLKKILDDREKANKKEEKKKEWDFTQTAMALVISYPIIGLIVYLLMRR